MFSLIFYDCFLVKLEWKKLRSIFNILTILYPECDFSTKKTGSELWFLWSQPAILEKERHATKNYPQDKPEIDSNHIQEETLTMNSNNNNNNFLHKKRKKMYLDYA